MSRPAQGETGARRNWRTLAAALAFPTFRFLERFLPVGFLKTVLWPVALLVTLVQLPKLRRTFSLFPDWLRPPRWVFLVSQPLRFALARFLTFWPDRLAGPRWRGRCKFTGDVGWMEAAKAGQPIVLVSLHFGPCVLLPYWLRAQGIPVATMSASRHGRSAFRERRYRLTPQPEVPVVFGVEEVRPALEFLQAGRTLLMLIDVPRGHQIEVPWNDAVLHLASGALRLAAKTGATLVPCLIHDTATWQFTIHSATAIPADRCVEESMPDVMRRLVDGWAPVLQKYPEQCEPDLLRSLMRASSPPANS